MHPALSIPEIVWSVCNELVTQKDDANGDGPGYDVHTRALAACARTCRAFYMPAVTALWKHDNLTIEIILLHCMPQDFWEKKPNTQSACAELLYPKRSVLPADVQRVMFHAPLVNQLSFGRAADGRSFTAYSRNGMEETGLSEEGYEAISSVLPHPVFVNLRHLFWYTSGASLSHIRPYLPPSLSSLMLKLSRSARPHISELSDLAVRCPYVTSFTLDTKNYNGDVEDVKALHSRLVQAWDLHSLESTILEHSTLVHVAQLSSLRQLINFRTDILRWKSISLAANAFASVRQLNLQRIDMRLCIDLLQSCVFKALEALELSPCNPATGDWTKLYRALRAAHTQPQLLRYLEIMQWNLDQTNAQHHDPVTDSDIFPLLGFTGLCSVELECQGGFDLEPKTLERMAGAWSDLSHLSLRGIERPQWQRRLTLHALVPFAIKCTELQGLALEFDGTGVSFDQNPPRPEKPSSLVSLTVEWSPINSSRAVAAFLSIYFPRLLIVDTAEGLPGKRWGRVGGLVKVFARIREHERMEAAGTAPPKFTWHIKVDDRELESDSSSDEEDE